MLIAGPHGNPAPLGNAEASAGLVLEKNNKKQQSLVVTREKSVKGEGFCEVPVVTGEDGIALGPCLFNGGVLPQPGLWRENL